MSARTTSICRTPQASQTAARPPAADLARLLYRSGRRARCGRIWRRGKSDEGFTLIELLVATLLALVVFGAILATLESGQQVQARDTEWALTMQEGRAGLARMAREIRQASKVEKAEAGTIEFLATIGSTAWKIKYECGVEQAGTEYHQCVRKAVEGSTGTLPSTGAPVVRDVLNPAEVFKYFKGTTSTATTTEMTVVTLKVELPAKGTLKQAGSSAYRQHVVLENAALMRNLYTGS
jgi:prepilin-type N-terminal cleavage/methylation domain-containing protein